MNLVVLLMAIAMAASGCVTLNPRPQILGYGMQMPSQLPDGAAEFERTAASREQGVTNEWQHQQSQSERYRERQAEHEAARRDLAERFPCAKPIVTGKVCGSPEEHSIPKATDSFRCSPTKVLTVFGYMDAMTCMGCGVSPGHPVLVRQSTSAPLFLGNGPRPELGDFVEVVMEDENSPSVPPYLFWARGQDITCLGQNETTTDQRYVSAPHRSSTAEGEPAEPHSANDPRQSALIDEAAKLGFDPPLFQSTLMAGVHGNALTCGSYPQVMRVMRAVSPDVISECALTPCPWSQDNLSCGLARLGFDSRGSLRYFQVTLHRTNSRPHDNDYVNRFGRLYGNTNRKIDVTEDSLTIANEVTVPGVDISYAYSNEFKEEAETAFLIYAAK